MRRFELALNYLINNIYIQTAPEYSGYRTWISSTGRTGSHQYLTRRRNDPHIQFSIIFTTHHNVLRRVDCPLFVHNRQKQSAVPRMRNYRLPTLLRPHATFDCMKLKLPNIHSVRSRRDAQLNGIHQVYGSYFRLANFKSFFVKPIISNARA
jgi:hypothetical protein